jgi:hypothetical protein
VAEENRVDTVRLAFDKIHKMQWIKYRRAPVHIRHGALSPRGRVIPCTKRLDRLFAKGSGAAGRARRLQLAKPGIGQSDFKQCDLCSLTKVRSS